MLYKRTLFLRLKLTILSLSGPCFMSCEESNNYEAALHALDKEYVMLEHAIHQKVKALRNQRDVMNDDRGFLIGLVEDIYNKAVIQDDKATQRAAMRIIQEMTAQQEFEDAVVYSEDNNGTLKINL